MLFGCGTFFHPKGRTQIEGVCKQGSEDNVWILEKVT
jgi:hypothetical protein